MCVRMREIHSEKIQGNIWYEIEERRNRKREKLQGDRRYEIDRESVGGCVGGCDFVAQVTKPSSGQFHQR